MKTKVWQLVAASLAIALCVSLPACNRRGATYTADGMKATINEYADNSNVTRDNAERVALGMSENEVADILGNPFHTSEQMMDGKNVKLAVWQNQASNVAVTFENGRVQYKVANFQ